MAIDNVRLNLKGLNAIMRAQQPTLDAVGRRMAARAGEGIVYVPKPHPWTARGYVQTATREGRRREAEQKVLIRSLQGG